MQHFVERLLSPEVAPGPWPIGARYVEERSLTLDATGRPYVAAARGLLATERTLDIDTRMAADRGPDE